VSELLPLPPHVAVFPNGAGEMADRVRTFDWSRTSVGAIGQWPQSLKTITNFLIQSPIPIVLLWGADGNMIFNDAYSVFAGDRYPEKLGAKVLEAWPEVAAFNANVMRVGMAGKTLAYQDQELTLHRNGRAEQVWMNLDYSPVFGEDGQPAGVIAVVVETSERVLMNRRLASERDQLALMFEQAPTFMAMLKGPDHRIELTNPGYLQLIGHREVLGLTVAEALPEAVAQGFVMLLDQVFESGEAHVGTGTQWGVQPVVGGPIKVRYVDFVYQPIRDATGAVVGIFVLGSDVTDRTIADEALRASESRLRELNADLERQVVQRAQVRGRTWQVTPDLLGALNSEGYFETSNPAWKMVLGWTEDEVRSMSIFELLHPDDVERTRGGFILTQQGQPAIRFPNRYRCKDGGYRWISWVGIPEDGMVYCSGRDITEEKAAEAELAQAQAELRQAQKMEAVGQLTGGIAHDFNNLLAGISGSLELVEKRLAEGRLSGVQRYVDTAQSSARRAAALTQRLLAFSRRQTLDPKPTDINRLVAGMEELIHRTTGPTISVEVVGAAGLWLTHVDQSQLESALLNLAINARDAMPDGGRLTIETANKWLDQYAAKERDLAPGQYVSLCVTDTGIGMGPDIISRAFDPFFTTKPLGQGTGLGLSMIHGFARQSGGQVRVYSEVGMGTTMCLYFPRHVGELDKADLRESDVHAEAAPGETVLIIDDEESIRMLMMVVLEEAGYRVIEAADGVAGLKILQSAVAIDLLISDVGLPGGLNGRQVADAARIARPGLKVLFVTGYAENAVIGNGHLDAGMQVITKPFGMVALSARVREIIDS
jgi:PAS domain S-box-containing protein